MRGVSAFCLAVMASADACDPSCTRAEHFSEDAKVQELMPLFYSRLFPCKEIMRCALEFVTLSARFSSPVACIIAFESVCFRSAHSWLAYGNDQKHAQADATFIQVRLRGTFAHLRCAPVGVLSRAAPLLH